MTPTERKARFDALETIGCCVCRIHRGVRTRPAIHHLRGSQYGTGTSLKARDELTIGLCPVHHQDGGYGVAYHAGAGAFEERYGTQAELLEWTNTQINNLRAHNGARN